MEQVENLDIRLATGEDLDAARRLFEAYPYKTMQQVVQGLDRGRLVELYTANLKGALEAGWPHWVVERSGEVVALAGLSDDKWHTEIYGFKMGKIGPWLNTVAPEVGLSLLEEAEWHARDRHYKHLSARVDGEDFRSLQLFESQGWYLVDVSLKFSRPMPLGERRQPKPAAADGWTVDLAGAEDSSWIRRIGSRTHAGTHFLNDPALPAEKTRELFALWLERCIERLAYRIYTLRDPEGQGRGFVTYLRSGAFARSVGRVPIILDFVLLDPAVRGGGLGPWFIEESLAGEAESGFDYCELRTSAHNLPAVNCYEKLGFRLCATDFVLHKAFK